MIEEALQIAEKTKDMKGKEERESSHPTECRVPENSKERLEISSRKSEMPKEHFMQRWAR